MDKKQEVVYRDDGMCFVCGHKNPIGLKLHFTLTDDGALETRFTPKKVHQGYADVVHGGILATILDEVMVNLPYQLGRKAITARMTVNLNRPAKVGEELVFRAQLVRETRRTIDAHATATTADGRVVADAMGTLMKIST
jgi:uncharacterized protein (TIGR00369 family)